MRLLITDIAALNKLRKGKKIPEFHLEFPELNATENAEWDQKISKDYFACGCGTGKVFLALSILSLGVYYIAWDQWREIFHLKQLVMVVLIVFTCSMVGKGIGLLRAKRSLLQLLDLLESEILLRTSRKKQ